MMQPTPAALPATWFVAPSRLGCTRGRGSRRRGRRSCVTARCGGIATWSSVFANTHLSAACLSGQRPPWAGALECMRVRHVYGHARYAAPCIFTSLLARPLRYCRASRFWTLVHRPARCRCSPSCTRHGMASVLGTTSCPSARRSTNGHGLRARSVEGHAATAADVRSAPRVFELNPDMGSMLNDTWAWCPEIMLRRCRCAGRWARTWASLWRAAT